MMGRGSWLKMWGRNAWGAVALALVASACVPEATPVMPEPPAPLPEMAQTPPTAGMVWIPGCWHWDGSGYVWLPGHWETPKNDG
ncbi:MAG: YXWGXW repeat-containing protein [Polyangiaceae bacterium]|nr:YXWGXW repeat-containing protein [Polyangiaceae bacterium]